MSIRDSRTQYLAHSRNDDGRGVAEPLADHLRLVAARAADFASAFGAGQQGFAAGLLHDLGKYSPQFLRRLDPGSGERGRDHWSIGAMACAASYAGQRLGAVPALAIAAHHLGLNFLENEKAICKGITRRIQAEPARFTETDSQRIRERFEADGLSFPGVSEGLAMRQAEANDAAVAEMVDVRMLFSALVDADFLETEAHFNGDASEPRRYRPEGPALDVDRALDVLDSHVAGLRKEPAAGQMQQVRDQLLQRCVAAGRDNRTGLFTLAAPTGSGKTLAMLAFALHHAKQHGLRRIVLVMPFLNIIEQTAKVYRDVFSEKNGFPVHAVLEDHSLARERSLDGEGEPHDGMEAVGRLLAENWDAPIVLTTSVQCLESLMANRPSRCRKLHRLARSVILFDEVQTLPPKLAVATLATLSRLADPRGPYRSTVLLATATQPAFDVLDGRVREFTRSGWRPREIMPDGQRMFAVAARRVRVSWRHTESIALSDLANELRTHRQVLCIVNLKRHAIELAQRLQAADAAGVLHLSTNMCPAHRTKVLAAVKQRLPSEAPLRLIATQCVEAGVDLDFPLVYRALAPLEAIAQAAGRCNRHGRKSGKVIVFKPFDSQGLYPPGYKQAVLATELYLAGLQAAGHELDATEIINDPGRLRAYFRHLYGSSGRATDALADERLVLDAIRTGDFEDLAREYRLIEDNTVNVLVRHDEEEFERLAKKLRQRESQSPGWLRAWIREATPYAVAVYPKPALQNHLLPVECSRSSVSRESNWFIAADTLPYDELLGLAEPEFADAWIA